MSKHILITGATGFIGESLVNGILADGSYEKVFLLQRNPPDGSSSLFSRAAASGITFLKADISDKRTLNEVWEQISGEKIRHFVHMAASVCMYAPPGEIDPVNVEGTINIADLARKCGVERFLFTSSIEAAGPVTQDEAPADENIRPKPVSSYGRSKLKAEEALWKLFPEGDTVTPVILRLANVYGPGSSFLTGDIEKEIGIKGLLYRALPYIGENVLHPVMVEDIANAIISSLHESTAPRRIPYFIAGKKSFTLNEVFREISRKRGGEDFPIPQKSLANFARIQYVRMKDRMNKGGSLISYFYGEPPRTVRSYSIEAAERDLSFSPEHIFPR